MKKHDKHKASSLKEFEKELVNKITNQRNDAAIKFPLGFALVATFGLIATMQGFQKLMEKIPLISNNPWISFVSGIAVLFATGTIYKKLG